MDAQISEQEAAKNVSAWSAEDPAFAALLAAGIPVHQALARRGMTLLRQNRSAEAAASFRNALALEPNSAVLWLNLGLSLNQSNSFSRAAACFEKSLSVAPAQADAWLLLGLARKNNGDAVSAETAYRRALELEPALAPAWQSLSLIMEEQRDYPAAIECLTTCVKHGGGNAPVMANLGKLCYQTGKFAEALATFQKAVELDRNTPHFGVMLAKSRFLCDMIDNVPVGDGMAAYRFSLSAPENCADAGMMDFFETAVGMLGGFGYLEAALRLGRERPKSWPPSPTVDYLMHSISGDAQLDRSPPEFIARHFDLLAENFDSRLVNELHYDIPAKLVKAIDSITPSGHLYDTLDAGCGTGLGGPALRSRSKTLAGVDLSPKMLEMAARRGIYDRLACEEVTDYLRHSPAQFDLVSATDLLIYIGDIAPIFAAAAGAIRPGGLFACSTEMGPESGYRLLASGHFGHALEYVQTIAASHFAQEYCSETMVRLEANRPLRGHLFLFRRR
jgi:predicted TPR repeat methyltransferase